MKSARATACSNIALCKYWGKRIDTDRALNLPAVGSLSLTLDALRTETTLSPDDADVFELDGAVTSGSAATKVFAHLDMVWSTAHAGTPRPPYRVVSANHFPTAAGLASSASGFAALTVAAAAAFEIDAAPTRLSSWARMGSGSAARSIWGGFVRLDRGHAIDGSDCLARPVQPSRPWDLRLLVVQTTVGKKSIGSTDGMEQSRRTSPYYDAWVKSTEADLDAAEAAIVACDFEELGRITEHSAFKMHACMIATDPALLYWNGTTVEAIHAVRAARKEGLEGFVTIDAGPHVKVLCASNTAEPLAARLAQVPGVVKVIVAAPGPDAHAEVSG
jgi:diphosphomevalonate decarboxylase